MNNIRPVTQEWTHNLTLMMQTVLLTAIRGADGIHKNHVSKLLCRWLRRCILLSAFDRTVLKFPFNPGKQEGGSFTGASIEWDEKCDGPWEVGMDNLIDIYLQHVDDLPHHFQLHIMHAAEILGYYHPDSRTRSWWSRTYERLAGDMHLIAESKEQLDYRLGDSEIQWMHCETAPAKHPDKKV